MINIHKKCLMCLDDNVERNLSEEDHQCPEKNSNDSTRIHIIYNHIETKIYTVIVHKRGTKAR